MFYKHLLEIKYRIFFSFIAWSFLTINCYFFKETLLYLFVKCITDYNCDNKFYFLTTHVTEVFIIYLQLSYFIANQLTLFFVSYQFFVFISSGLYTFERLYISNTGITIFVCWIMMVLLLNYFIFPTSWDFFFKFQTFTLIQAIPFYFEAKLSECWAFYIVIYYISCFVYQLAIFFFIFLNLFKTNFFIVKKLRKIFYFAFLVIATFITPPDTLCQLIIGAVLTLAYELLLIHLLLKIELICFK